MKEEKIVVSHLREKAWNENKDQGKFRWKHMTDSTLMKSHGLSCGLLVLPPGEELPLHHHSPQEVYIIRQGEGVLLSSSNSNSNSKKICKDSFVYIPENIQHGLKNTGEEDLEILWIFPTDCWEEVEYIFEK
ncbi:cupin domain-containing protein [Paracoccaceae bacterium]|nr:cupin domain-containing protein [Paracoccaceae bacterium]